MPTITFDHNVTFEGKYYLRGSNYTVPQGTVDALGSECKVVKSGILTPKKEVSKVAEKKAPKNPAKGFGKTPAKTKEPKEIGTPEAKEVANQGGENKTATPAKVE